jgi:ubiquinone/menaquinone biosynthesis C-methylase UbiE
MNYEDNPKSIKYYVKRFLTNNQERFQGKRIVDFPAGNGVTSRLLKEIGAEPLAYDLFPEYFDVENMECQRANIKTGIPLEDKSAEGFICQEGIEHFSDQFEALKEFNRG